MKKLIEALHVIKDECLSHFDKEGNLNCYKCRLSANGGAECLVSHDSPDAWKINDEVPKALL